MVVFMADCTLSLGCLSLLVVESLVFIVFISIAGLQVATDDSNSECTVSDTHLDTKVIMSLHLSPVCTCILIITLCTC